MTKKTAGYPYHVVETYDTLEVGTVQVGEQRAPISSRSIPCYKVTVQSSYNNGQTLLYVGSAGGCYHELGAGEWVTIEINDVEKVYARAALGTLTVNWMAEV
jgi:hypothetical protein